MHVTPGTTLPFYSFKRSRAVKIQTDFQEERNVISCSLFVIRHLNVHVYMWGSTCGLSNICKILVAGLMCHISVCGRSVNVWMVYVLQQNRFWMFLTQNETLLASLSEHYSDGGCVYFEIHFFQLQVFFTELLHKATPVITPREPEKHSESRGSRGMQIRLLVRLVLWHYADPAFGPLGF